MSTGRVSLIAFCCGTIVAGAAGGGATYYISQFPTEEEVRLREQISTAENKAEMINADLKSKTKEIDDLRNKSPELHRSIRAAENELHERQSELKDIDDQIKRARSVLEELGQAVAAVKSLRPADFLMVGGDTIVGIAHRNGEFRLLSEVRGTLAQIARPAVVRWRMPMCTNDTELCRQISVAYDPGSSMGSEESRRLAAIYDNHRFVSTAPDRDGDLVVYRDLEVDAYRVGYYRGNDNQEMTLQTVDQVGERVSRTRVAPGSALRGRAEAFAEAAQHLNFVDLCALEIARRIGTPDGQRSLPPRMIVFVECTIGGAANSSHYPRETSSPGNPLAGFQLLHSVDSEAQQLNPTTLAREIEDRLYERLTHLGVPVVERDRLDALNRERRLARERNQTFDSGLRLAGTHLFTCKIDLSSATSGARLAVRLVEIGSEEVKWACNFTPTAPEVEHTRYAVASGAPFIINLPAKPNGLKAAPILGQPLDPYSSETMTNRFVIFEPGLAPKGQVALRDPFSSAVVYADVDQFEKDRTRKIASGNDVPIEHIPAYLVYSIFRATMPRAGLVVAVNEDAVDVRMVGADKLVTPGRTMPAYHPQAAGEGIALPERLYVNVAVQTATDIGLRASHRSARIVPLWTEYAQLAPGDIVVPSGQEPAKVTFLGFERVAPPESYWRSIPGKDKEKKWAAAQQRTIEAEGRLTKGLVDACGMVGLDATAQGDVHNAAYESNRYGRRGYEQPKADQYQVVGTISPMSLKQYKVTLTVRDADNRTVLTEQVVVNSKQLESWDPTI